MKEVRTPLLPPKPELERFMFIAADWRKPGVLGWRSPLGFFPDEPLETLDGFLIRIKETP